MQAWPFVTTLLSWQPLIYKQHLPSFHDHLLVYHGILTQLEFQGILEIL